MGNMIFAEARGWRGGGGESVMWHRIGPRSHNPSGCAIRFVRTAPPRPHSQEDEQDGHAEDAGAAAKHGGDGTPGQWSVASGQWSVVSGRRDCFAVGIGCCSPRRGTSRSNVSARCPPIWASASAKSVCWSLEEPPSLRTPLPRFRHHGLPRQRNHDRIGRPSTPHSLTHQPHTQ
jgi:hypothetical protein